MAIEKVKEYFRRFGMEDRVREFPVSQRYRCIGCPGVGL